MNRDKKYYCSVGISRSWDLFFKEKPPFESCCAQHDYEYKHTDVSITRLESDKKLYKCVHKAGNKWQATLIYTAVRLFGWLYFKKRKI